MKKFLLTPIAFLISMFSYSQETTTAERIDIQFEKYTGWFVEGIFYEIPITEEFQIPWVLFVLIGGALYFTIYFKLINITGFLTAIRVVRGKYEDIEKHDADTLYGDVTPNEQADIIETIRDDGADGEVSHFQALTAALSATVGLGNIAGVAIAISIGGPGATFWMILAGLLGMSSKFAECTLGVKYRRIDADGTVSGGPMYYLSRGLAEHRPSLAGLGKVLAVAFSICCIGGSLGAGNMFQVNQGFQQVLEVTGGADSALAGKGWLFGLAMAALVAVVIIGGLKSIARVTSKLVPVMAVLYVACSVYIVFANIENVVPAMRTIVEGAFTPEAEYGGFIGVLIQ